MSATVKPPVCGEETKTSKDPNYTEMWDFNSQTNTPRYSFPAGADYEEFDFGDAIPYPKSFWGKRDSAEGGSMDTEPFVGGFEGGKSYDFGLLMMPKYGYGFVSDATVSVNGNKAKEVESIVGLMLAAFSDVEAEHAWDAGKVTKAATTREAGEKIYTCTSCKSTKTEIIPKLGKKVNPLKVKGKTVKVKYKKLKRKNQYIKRAKAIKVTAPQGKVTYKKVRVSYTKAKSVKLSKKALKKYKKNVTKKIAINSGTGKITVKKGLKKGTYKVKVKVKAAGNEEYDPSKTETVTIKVVIK